MTGGADAGLILDRNSQGTTLYVRGRDIDEKESAVTFDKLTCRWRVLGEASEVRRSDERKKILDFLKGASEPLGPRQIAAGIEMPVKNVDRLLSKLVTAGEVEKAGRGGTSTPREPTSGGRMPMRTSCSYTPKKPQTGPKMTTREGCTAWLDHTYS